MGTLVRPLWRVAGSRAKAPSLTARPVSGTRLHASAVSHAAMDYHATQGATPHCKILLQHTATHATQGMCICVCDYSCRCACMWNTMIGGKGDEAASVQRSSDCVWWEGEIKSVVSEATMIDGRAAPAPSSSTFLPQTRPGSSSK